MKSICDKSRCLASILFTIAILILSFSLGSLLLTKLIFGKASIFGYRPFLVVSESMYPGLQVGDIVIGKPVVADELQENDVIAYTVASPKISFVKATVIHRVIDFTGDKIICKGDNNEFLDEPIEKTMVQYKIVFPNI